MDIIPENEKVEEDQTNDQQGLPQDQPLETPTAYVEQIENKNGSEEIGEQFKESNKPSFYELDMPENPFADKEDQQQDKDDSAEFNPQDFEQQESQVNAIRIPVQAKASKPYDQNYKQMGLKMGVQGPSIGITNAMQQQINDQELSNQRRMIEQDIKRSKEKFDSDLKRQQQLLEQQSAMMVSKANQEIDKHAEVVQKNLKLTKEQNEKAEKELNKLKQQTQQQMKGAQEQLNKQTKKAEEQIAQKAKESSDKVQQNLNKQMEKSQDTINKASQKLNDQTQKINNLAPFVALANPQAAKQIEQVQRGLNKTNTLVQEKGQQANQQINFQQQSLNQNFSTVKQALDQKQMNQQATVQVVGGSLGAALAVGLVSGSVLGITKKTTQKLVSQANLERKQEWFAQIKDWEVSRVGILQAHRKLLESLNERMLKRAEVSDHSVSQLMIYYQQRAEFEEGCSAFYQKQNQLGRLFKEQEDKIVHVYYPGYTRTLQNLDEVNQRQAKQIGNLVIYLRGQMKDIFEQERGNFQNVVKDMRDGFSRIRKRIADSLQQADKLFIKYKKYYIEDNSLQMKNKKPLDDLYNHEKKYKYAVQQLLFDQCELGDFVVEKWNQLLQLEAQRLQVIQKALQNLQYEYVRCYGKSSVQSEIEQILNELKPLEECEAFWGSKTLLAQSEFEYIKEYLHKEQLEFKDIKYYFVGLRLEEDFLVHPLVNISILYYQRCLSKYGVIRMQGQLVKLGSLSIQLQQSIIIYQFLMNPSQGYIRRFLQQQTYFQKADLKIQIKGIQMKQRVNEKLDRNMVDVSYVVPGLLIDSKKKILLKFNTDDDLEEVRLFLQTVGQNNYCTEVDEIQQI